MPLDEQLQGFREEILAAIAGVKLEVIAEMRTELGGIRTEIGAEIGGLRAELGGIHTELGGIHTEIGGIHTEIGGLRAEIGGLRKAVEIIAIKLLSEPEVEEVRRAAAR